MQQPHNYLDDYLDDVLARGRYAVTLAELIDRFDVSGSAIQQSIYRLKKKNRLAHVRKEFYVIVPPQYAHRGMVPSSLIIDDLMAYLKRPYYVGALSAAALHGAGHQQPMQFQVMTIKPPMRPIRNEVLDIRFFVKSAWREADIEQRKTDAGFIKVSSPALTAFDLVHYHKGIGGIDRIIPILDELAEAIRPSGLRSVAAHQNVPDTQRLGYLFDRLGHEGNASALHQCIRTTPTRPIALSLAHADRTGPLDPTWNVIVNSTPDL